VTEVLSLLLGVAVVLGITVLTGYFVAQEFAFMAVDRAGLAARAEAGDAAAHRALAVTRRTSFLLSGAQLGITLTGLMVGYVAEPLIGEALGSLLGGVGIPVGVSVVIMLALTVFCQFGSHLLMHMFTHEEAVVAVGATFLAITSWNFAANGIIFSCSSMFQGLGNTWPTISSSVIRVFIFIVPVLWLARQPEFQLVHVWYLGVASMFLQAIVSLLLVRREFAKRLTPMVGLETAPTL